VSPRTAVRPNAGQGSVAAQRGAVPGMRAANGKRGKAQVTDASLNVSPQAMRTLLFAALVGLSAGSALGPLPSAPGSRLTRVRPGAPRKRTQATALILALRAYAGSTAGAACCARYARAPPGPLAGAAQQPPARLCLQG